jgi:cyclophilin family peptidyl-prolyl cis-trans isomerase
MQIKYCFVQIHLFILTLIAIPVFGDEPLTTQSVIESSSVADWRTPDPANLLYMQLDDGQIVFELAPTFAPNLVENIRRLVANHYFDGLSIIRSQDNYVVQWGDPAAGSENAKTLGKAKKELEPEFYRNRAGLDITKLDSQDAYADEVGFVDGFPVASDKNRAWLTHCYGMLGVGRDYAPNSGNGAELYVVTGHAPRHLDRNVTIIGRILMGVEYLSSLPRGTSELGFYKTEKEYVKIKSIRFGNEVEKSEQLNIEVMRTDTQTFTNFVKARTYRRHAWFVDPAGRIELCNVIVPVRMKKE